MTQSPNISLQNASKKDDAYFDQFRVRFHVSDQGFILSDERSTPILRNMAQELDLGLISCYYGDDAVGHDLHPSTLQLMKALETEYGPIERDMPGFIFSGETKVEKGKMVYFVAAGNNGQEISTGFYLSDESLLDDEEARNVMKELDDMFHAKVRQAGVRRREK